jgi:hypothetical protein
MSMSSSATRRRCGGIARQHRRHLASQGGLAGAALEREERDALRGADENRCPNTGNLSLSCGFLDATNRWATPAGKTQNARTANVVPTVMRGL